MAIAWPLFRKAAPADLTTTFRSLTEWDAWKAAHPQVFDPAYIESIVRHGVENGVRSRYLGRIKPKDIRVHGPNYRETFHARDFNPRQRAVLDRLLEIPSAADPMNCRIYAPEAVTNVALAVRGRYPKFLGSEYTADPAQKAALYPVPCLDFLNLDLPDATFDILMSNEVFEHVPDLPRSLSESARILKPGGTLFGTVPFHYNRAETVIKARLVNGEVSVIGEPEYHGNPVDPKGSLVFQIPGWDFLDMCRAAGFRDARMEFVSSHVRGITGAESAGVFLFVAER